MKYTHIIWDFNGTLFDDVDASLKSVNEMLEARNLPIVENAEEYRKVFRFPIIDYYKDLGFDFEKESFEDLAPIWVNIYNRNSANSPLQVGAIEALEFFKKEKVLQILLSATEVNMLTGQIKGLKIYPYFDKVLGLDNIQASSKKHIAVEWKRNNPDAVPLFIGDSEHDFEVAKAVDADCVLVSRGHQSKEALMKCGCKVCDDLYNLMSDLKN